LTSVTRGDLTDTNVIALLDEHLAEMREVTPDPDSVHALDITALQAPTIEFWVAWDEGRLVGCGALKRLSSVDAEVKSMRTARSFRGRGVAQAMLEALIASAGKSGYHRLLLETGSGDFYAPARRLYQRNGFLVRGPFAGYADDLNSVFMELALSPDPADPRNSV
jgi:putative acetyltransferase